jgi:hypothetical protein
MANDYLGVYERLLAAGTTGGHPHRRLGLVPADPSDAGAETDAGIETA